MRRCKLPYEIKTKKGFVVVDGGYRSSDPQVFAVSDAVDADICIGCGFCAGACLCGIWRLTENETVE